jgi:hypothetical protein
LFDGDSEPVPIDQGVRLVATYLEVSSTEKHGDVELMVGLMHCGLAHMKPGDRRKAWNGNELCYLGFADDGGLWFKDLVTGQVRRLPLAGLHPDFYEPDTF